MNTGNDREKEQLRAELAEEAHRAEDARRYRNDLLRKLADAERNGGSTEMLKDDIERFRLVEADYRDTYESKRQRLLQMDES